jgi:peptidase M23-like protein
LGPLVATALAALAFWPQAGVLGQDLYYANSVDLDPAAGATLDPWCGHRTYDTHTGDDITMRSFREVKIGVPVFSVSDGTITEVQDGMYDFHYGTTVSQFDNHLIVQAPDGRFFVYGHLRHGLTWKRGQTVHAGEQIAWAASSGNSSWPHLHFTELLDGMPRDPFAGPCRPGPSDFAIQPSAFRDAPYLRNLVVSPRPFTGQAQLPWDDAARTGTFVRGTRDIWFRIELGEYVSAAERIQIVRPDGTLAIDDPAPAKTPDGVGQGHGMAAFDFHERVRFDTLGAWRLRYTLNGQLLADAPLRVVAKTSQVRNRPPYPVSVSVSTTNGIAQCVVSTSLVARDPDYDVVRYRYRWVAATRTLRSVTSAGLSDVVPLPDAGGVRCEVTPSDGRLTARTASASAG